MGRECDGCDEDNYTEENPRVFHCQRRPSDKFELVCTLAGHWKCLGGRAAIQPYVPQLPTETSPNHALATAADLDNWFEEGKAGAAPFNYAFLTL